MFWNQNLKVREIEPKGTDCVTTKIRTFWFGFYHPKNLRHNVITIDNTNSNAHRHIDVEAAHGVGGGGAHPGACGYPLSWVREARRALQQLAWRGARGLGRHVHRAHGGRDPGPDQRPRAVQGFLFYLFFYLFIYLVVYFCSFHTVTLIFIIYHPIFS